MRIEKVEITNMVDAANENSHNALIYQRRFLESIPPKETLKMVQMEDINPDYMWGNEVLNFSVPKYQFSFDLVIPITNGSKVIPLVQIIENGDSYVILTVDSSNVQVRSLSSTGQIKHLLTYSLLQEETVTCLDSLRTDLEQYFSVGSINGIIYVFELTTGNKVIFNNHSNWVTWVKFNPDPEQDLIISTSTDWTIRLFNYKEETQIAVYQDPLNYWIKGKYLAWHEDGEKFMCVSDRGGLDLMHFFYLPDNEYYHKFSVVDEHLKRVQKKETQSESDSDSEREEKEQRIGKNPIKYIHTKF